MKTIREQIQDLEEIVQENRQKREGMAFNMLVIQAQYVEIAAQKEISALREKLKPEEEDSDVELAAIELLESRGYTVKKKKA